MTRPKSENPKDKRINLRLTKEEYDTIRYVAESLNLTMIEAIIVTMEERADEIYRTRKKWQPTKLETFYKNISAVLSNFIAKYRKRYN